MIANIDENGNDLGNLTLDTGSLAYTDIADHDKEKSYYLNVGFTMGDDTNTNQTESGNNYNASGNYSNHDKEQINRATVGEGNIIVRDNPQQDLSDLNRDTSIAQEITKDDSKDVNLYASTTALDSLGNLVESEEKRNEQLNKWKDNVASVGSTEAWGQVAENVTDVGEDIATTYSKLNEKDALGFGSFVDGLDANHKITQLKNDLKRTEEGRALLEQLQSDNPDERLAAQAAIGNLAQTKFGIDPSDILFYSEQETDSASLKSTLLADLKGGTVIEQGHDEYGNIFVNVDKATDAKDMANTIGHEVYETYTQQTGGANDATQEVIANMVGNQLANRLDQAVGGTLGNIGTGGLAGSATVQYGNTRADNVGNAQVDYRRLTLNEAQALDKVREVIQGNSSLSAEEKQIAHLQLNALACAAVECANGVSEKDPLYKDLLALQQAGESLQGQGMNLSEILGEDAAGQFTHGWRDEFNDALTRNDGALTVVGGIVQAAAGAAGVVGGVAMTAGGAVGCAPTAGLTCLAVPAGGAVTGLSASEFAAGLDKTFGDYTHTEGLGVALSLSGATHQGDVSPDIELLKGAGIVGLEILAAKVGGKALDKVLDKYQDVKSGQINHTDDMIPGADSAGNIGNIPNSVTRKDNDFSATTNTKNQKKSYIDEEGNLVPANPYGDITIQQHVRGADPAKSNSQYTSTTAVDGNTTSGVKNYGENTIEIDTKRLQQDINAGKVNDVEIIPPKRVQAELQNDVDQIQIRYDANPSPKNAQKLERAKQDLENATRDNECLIRGCVPSEYIKGGQ